MKKILPVLFFFLCFYLIYTFWPQGKQSFASKAEQTVYLFLGPPGAGKGVQADNLSAAFQIPHISTGDLFRENIKKGTPYGVKAKSLIEAGQLAPDQLVLDMLFDRVSQKDCVKGYILDGFPRTVFQAEALEKYLNAKDSKLIVVNFQASDDVVVERIAGRLVCKSCLKVHNLKTLGDNKICPECSGELYQRSDDNAAVVLKRLQVYHAETKPLEDYYKSQLIEVNSEQPSGQVFTELLQKIAS